MTPFPAPNRLHVWFARRPLVASRAAILGSLVGSKFDRAGFLHLLGIHGDPVATRHKIATANARGERLEANVYGYPRAFQHLPELGDLASRDAAVLDPTAGGGSIPFESVRLGFKTLANDLNPVAALLLKATVALPLQFGGKLLERYRELALEFKRRAESHFQDLFPPEGKDVITVDGYLWARTVTCPYCEGTVPLSPNWKLSSDGHGVRLIPEVSGSVRRVRFEIVDAPKAHSPGTVKGGDGLCPFHDCGRTIDGDEIKKQAQAGQMGHQLYCVVYKQERLKGYTKTGRPKYEKVRGFRAPRPEDDVDGIVQQRLAEKMPEWKARNIVPDEPYPTNTNDNRPINYGMPLWRDLFSPRQLYGHCQSVDIFQAMLNERPRSSLDDAALVYLAFAIDKVINYNSLLSRWDSVRVAIRGKFDRHDMAFQWSYGEMAPTITGLGYDWAVEQTGKALRELIELLGQQSDERETLGFVAPRPKPDIKISCSSADTLPLENESVDCIVMDPPYYQNVMYAELSDFFYVWLKRTAGLIYPELFTSTLTDKDREAVANLARFAGVKGGAKNHAKHDYQNRMAKIFAEQRRVLKPDGIMTVMFTHKETDAWDALSRGLIEAGFVITASWPVNTEAEGSLHIREKSAARSTIFLVCRVREEKPASGEPRFWEEYEPLVRGAVRAKVVEFQNAGISGIDLYLACFGPALEVFTEAWPLTRGRALQPPKGKQKELFGKFDPYAVRPEDALEAARAEVKQWRIEQLATVKRQHHLDALTEWYVLAWDAFRAPRFPSDEAIKLARVVGLDFDTQVKNVVGQVKGDDIALWDSKTRRLNGSLGGVSDECMIDTLHHVAWTIREQNTAAGRNLVEKAGLLEDPTLLTALEALLNVLPPGGAGRGKKKPDELLSGAANDFEALERLRKLAFPGVPEPKIPEQALLALTGDAGEEDEET
jgi:adenine-specific DNA methylase